MKLQTRKAGILAVMVMTVFFFSGWAKAPQKSPDLGLGPMKASAAYKQLMNRPMSEYSKTLYLIERFKNLPYEVIYDGAAYKLNAVAGLVRAFLRFNYKKELTAEQWVQKYAQRGMIKNQVIMLKLPDGSLYPAGNILLEELANLEAAIKEPVVSPIVLPETVHTALSNASIPSDKLPVAAPAPAV